MRREAPYPAYADGNINTDNDTGARLRNLRFGG